MIRKQPKLILTCIRFSGQIFMSGDLVCSQCERKRTAEYIAHIEQVLSHWPDRPIVLVTDNYQIHKTKAVKELKRREFGRFLQVYLPTYSPHLNPIEMLWRYIHHMVTHNYKFDTLAALMETEGRAQETLSSKPSYPS